MSCPCCELNHDSSVVQPVLRLVTIWNELSQLQYFNISLKQDRSCAYNLTLMSLCVTIVAVEKQHVLNMLSVYLFLLWISGMQSACAIIYCYLFPVWLFYISLRLIS
jgi:hypothetical protein